MKKRKVMALLLIFGIMLSAETACAKKTDIAPTDTTVVVHCETVNIGSLERLGNYVGTVADTEAVYVVPLVSATVRELPVKVGDYVQEGDVVCVLDDTVAQLKVSGAYADYSLASNGLDTATAGYNTAMANLENATNTVQAQVGGSKTLTDYQTDKSIESLEQQLTDLTNSMDGYVGLVDSANTALEVAKGAVAAATEEYETAKAIYEQLLNVATLGNATSSSEISEKKAVMDAAMLKLNTAKTAYGQAAAQVRTVNDGAITLQNNRSTLERAIEQAKQQKEIVDGEVYDDTNNIVESTKKVAQSAVATAEVGMETARIHMQAAQIGIDAAEYELSLYTLKAPVEGVIEQIQIIENNMAAAGNVGLVISNPDTKSVIFFVSGEVKKSLELGQKVEASCMGETYPGTVTEIGVSVDNMTGLFRVKASLEGAKNLSNGVKVELVTRTHSIDNSILVPWEAVYFENGKNYLYVYEDEKAKKTEVQIALYDTDVIALESGIVAGTEIITTWSSTLKDGANVRRVQEDR